MATAQVVLYQPNNGSGHAAASSAEDDKRKITTAHLNAYWKKVFVANSTLAVKLKPLRGALWDLEGNICAGKTTAGPKFVKKLSEVGIEAEFFSERMNNDLLEQFYSDPSKYSYMLQVYAASQCNTSHVKAQNATFKGKVGLVDRGGWGNRVFEDLNHDLGNLSEGEHSSYASMILDFEPVNVDGVLYIDVSPKHCYERNKKRAVKAERAIKFDYLNDLDRYYCHQVVHRLHDGSSNVLVIQDATGEFLNEDFILEQMARFMTRFGSGVLPGQAFLQANWERFQNIKHESEEMRRQLMGELAEVQREILTSNL